MSVQATTDNWQVIRDGLGWLSASWRWSRACLLARHHRRCDSRWGDDEFTQFAVLHQHYAADRTLAERIKSSPMLAAVAGAIQVANGPENERLAVEARLIALDSLEAIASKTDKPVAVIEAYEMLFCDFRDRHGCDTWMCDRVFRAHIHLNRPQLLSTAVLRLAYGGGAAAADAVLRAVAAVGTEPSWEQLAKAAVIGGDTPLIDRLSLLAVATEMAPKTAEALAKLQRRHRKVLRSGGLVRRDVTRGGDIVVTAYGSSRPLWEHLREQIEAAYASPSRDRARAVVA